MSSFRGCLHKSWLHDVRNPTQLVGACFPFARVFGAAGGSGGAAFAGASPAPAFAAGRFLGAAAFARASKARDSIALR